MFAPQPVVVVAPVATPEPPVVAPEPPVAAPVPVVMAALPESMVVETAAVADPIPLPEPEPEPETPAAPAASEIPGRNDPVVRLASAEGTLAVYIARWEPLIFLWAGGTPDVCAPYAGGTMDQRGWKARWMALAEAEDVLAQWGYTLHAQHEGPFPSGGGARTARVWLRPRTAEERGRLPPVALLAAALAVPESLDDLARVRQQAIP